MTGIASHGGAEDPRPVKVGVLLDRETGRIGEWLADAGAFDAGGADALWIDLGPEPELDVLALAAALAVVTFRARLVVALPGAGNDVGLGRTIETIGRLGQGRLDVLADSDQCVAPGVGMFRRVPGEPGTFEGVWAQRWAAATICSSRRVDPLGACLPVAVLGGAIDPGPPRSPTRTCGSGLEPTSPTSAG